MPSKLYKGIMPERGIISSRNSLHKGSEFLALSNKISRGRRILQKTPTTKKLGTESPRDSQERTLQMSLEIQSKQIQQQLQQSQQQQQRRDLDFLDAGDTNLGKYHDFDNIALGMEDVAHDNFDADCLQGSKIRTGVPPYRTQSQNIGNDHQDFLQANGKYQDFFSSNLSAQNGGQEGHYLQFHSSFENQLKGKLGGYNENSKGQNGQAGGTAFQFGNSSSGKEGADNQLLQQSTQHQGAMKQKTSPVDQEQQKQIKLITALKSKPQDLEQILEEQEKQNQIQKKLKIENDAKNGNLSKPSSSIQLTNYSPTRENLKRVESNTSLNGGIDKPQHSKNLSKIKGNVKNAYIKKITSLLNLQNQAPSEQNDNLQDQRKIENSDDSDNSNSKSCDNTKQEDGKKVMKNRESARNSRQRKKIYIELLEKKINDLQTQIEDQCVGIEKSQKEICKILDNHNHIKAFVQTRHDYLQKIGEMANAEKPNTESLGYILDSLRLRIGAQGTCRQKAMSLYFRTIMKYFMQSTVPYLIYGYQPNISEDQEFNRCVEIFKKICNIQDETQVFKFLPCLKKFLESRENFKACYRQMKKIRKSAFKREESIEKLLDGLSLLHPTQMGKFLKGLDKFRKCKEIRLQTKSSLENTEQFEIDSNVFKKNAPSQEKQIQKLRQYTLQNQFISNNGINEFPQTHRATSLYPPQIPHSGHNLEMEDPQMDLAQQPKPIGFNSSYYYPKHLHVGQNGIGQGYQKYIQVGGQPQNINTTINSKPPELEQYYHQQPYKIPPYKEHPPNNNIPY